MLCESRLCRRVKTVQPVHVTTPPLNSIPLKVQLQNPTTSSQNPDPAPAAFGAGIKSIVPLGKDRSTSPRHHPAPQLEIRSQKIIPPPNAQTALAAFDAGLESIVPPGKAGLAWKMVSLWTRSQSQPRPRWSQRPFSQSTPPPRPSTQSHSESDHKKTTPPPPNPTALAAFWRWVKVDLCRRGQALGLVFLCMGRGLGWGGLTTTSLHVNPDALPAPLQPPTKSLLNRLQTKTDRAVPARRPEAATEGGADVLRSIEVRPAPNHRAGSVRRPPWIVHRRSVGVNRASLHSVISCSKLTSCVPFDRHQSSLAQNGKDLATSLMVPARPGWGVSIRPTGSHARQSVVFEGNWPRSGDRSYRVHGLGECLR